MNVVVFPYILITLNCCASAVYFWHGEYWKGIYWFAAGVLNFSIVMQ